jgi:hypothetical protein
MAHIVDQVRMFFTSANTDYQEDSLVFEYRVYDSSNGMEKYVRWEASGLDMSQTASGVWEEAITSIETLEGI